MISVVIPAYNEEKNIAKTLESLVNQKIMIPFEVIVVDNNSVDKTINVVKKFSKRLKLKIFMQKRKGRGMARATGFGKARGDIVFSMDADTVVSTYWMETMLSYFKDPTTVAVTGSWKVEDCKGFTKWFLNNCQTVAMIPYLFYRGHYWLTGFNFAIRNSVYQKAGGFNAVLNAHEDIDLTERVRKLGKIRYAKDAEVITSGRRYANGLWRGLWSYQEIGIKVFLFKDKKIVLKDQR